MSFKQKLKSDLKQLGGLKVIRNSLSTIIFSYLQSEEPNTAELLPTIKDILLDVVDEIWDLGRKMFEITEKVRVIKRNYSGCATRQKFVNYETQSSDKPIDRNPKFSEIISEFTYAKGPTFSKSIREIDRKIDISPGPACYKFSSKDNLSTPPRVIFPKVTKRHSYIPSTYSPGPAKYYSNLRGVSKH